jgi:Fibronectin type III domain
MLQRILIAALASTLIALGAAASAAGALKPPAKLRVAAAGKTTITLAWRDRSRGERQYRATAGGAGSSRGGVAGANSTRLRIRGLKPGTLYRYRLRACRGKRCSKARGGRAATLLTRFNGPHADPRCTVLPAGDEFHRDISTAAADPRSEAIVDQILADGGDSLHPDFGSNPSYGIPYVVVPAAQPTVPIKFTAYGDESDRGPYPIPPGAPVEGGARADGDRHVLVVRRPRDPGSGCDLFELYRSFERGGRRNAWSGDSGAIFDLGAPLIGQRPAGWTSADAAGLPIFPGLVTYEEVRSGEIDHAIRITVEETRRGYYPPATHWASSSCKQFRPAMGMRLRLRPGFDLSGFSGDSLVIARALKRYGAIVADNGSNFFISGSTDRRWDDEDLNQLKQVPGAAFEVVGPEAAEVSDC